MFQILFNQILYIFKKKIKITFILNLIDGILFFIQWLTILDV